MSDLLRNLARSLNILHWPIVGTLIGTIDELLSHKKTVLPILYAVIVLVMYAIPDMRPYAFEIAVTVGTVVLVAVYGVSWVDANAISRATFGDITEADLTDVLQKMAEVFKPIADEPDAPPAPPTVAEVDAAILVPSGEEDAGAQ